LGISTRLADITEEGSLIKLKDVKPDFVINLVGILNAKKEDLYKIHVIGVTNLLKNFKDAKFIHVSALSCESQTTEYFKTKFAAESLIKSSGINYTIFRPSIVYSKESEFLNILGKITKLPITPVIGNGEYKLQIIHLQDFCKILTDSVFREECKNKVYEVGGPEKLRFIDILRMYKEKFGIKSKELHIPMSLAQFLLPLSRFFGVEVNEEAIKMLAQGSVVNEQFTYPFLEPKIEFRRFLEDLEV
jgi:NADH dehydrogenase